MMDVPDQSVLQDLKVAPDKLVSLEKKEAEEKMVNQVSRDQVASQEQLVLQVSKEKLDPLDLLDHKV